MNFMKFNCCFFFFAWALSGKGRFSSDTNSYRSFGTHENTSNSIGNLLQVTRVLFFLASAMFHIKFYLGTSHLKRTDSSFSTQDLDLDLRLSLCHFCLNKWNAALEQASIVLISYLVLARRILWFASRFLLAECHFFTDFSQFFSCCLTSFLTQLPVTFFWLNWNATILLSFFSELFCLSSNSTWTSFGLRKLVFPQTGFTWTNSSTDI